MLGATTLLAILTACGSPPPPTPTPIFVLPTEGIAILPTDSPDTTVIPSNSTPPAGTTSAQGSTPSVATSTANIPATPAPTLPAGKMSVKIFLVAINDNGKSGKKIGCNDSIVAVDRVIPETQGVLAAALNELFSIRDKTLGSSGLYNSLYQSSLKLDGAAVITGKATIALSGKLMLGGVCDDPRAKNQIEETALQFATVKSVAVTINGVAIDKALSEK